MSQAIDFRPWAKHSPGDIGQILAYSDLRVKRLEHCFAFEEIAARSHQLLRLANFKPRHSLLSHYWIQFKYSFSVVGLDYPVPLFSVTAKLLYLEAYARCLYTEEEFMASTLAGPSAPGVGVHTTWRNLSDRLAFLSDRLDAMKREARRLSRRGAIDDPKLTVSKPSQQESLRPVRSTLSSPPVIPARTSSSRRFHPTEQDPPPSYDTPPTYLDATRSTNDDISTSQSPSISRPAHAAQQNRIVFLENAIIHHQTTECRLRREIEDFRRELEIVRSGHSDEDDE